MVAYYNEIDPFNAAWLRVLIDNDHIAPGEVDERDIRDVFPDDLRGFDQCHFFAGIGVWSYALRLAGWPDDRPVWTGSCPCQPFSTAGSKSGFADERHLWPAFCWHIRQHHPDVVFGEQVASPDGLGWLDLISVDLENEGYAVGAADLCAAGLGLPHIRQRLFWVADSEGERRREARADIGRSEERARYRREPCGVADSNESRPQRRGFGRNGPDQWPSRPGRLADWIPCRDGKARPVEPGTFPLVNGTPARVGRLRGYGNAIVAPLAAAFIEEFMSL